MRKTLYIIRGASGSGKSTLADEIDNIWQIWEADMYFTDDITQEYNFVPELLPLAHRWCQNQIRKCMERGDKRVAVANTFTKNWEMKPYLDMCEEFGYTPFVIRCENAFDNIPDVPEDIVNKQRKRFEDFDLNIQGERNA